VHPIVNPFEQAKTSKYALRNLLKANKLGSIYTLNLGHAVAFPDVLVADEFLGLDRPRAIVFGQEDLMDIATWVDNSLVYWRGVQPEAAGAPTQAVIDELVHLLTVSWELRPQLWGAIVSEQQQLIRLTEQQYIVLNALGRLNRAAISGCAGSGKTLLAVEKASRLARQGLRVLLTCYNHALADSLRARLNHGLTILHYHDLCYRMARAAGVLPEKKDDQYYYEKQLPQALAKAAERLSERFDAIVVDEGQDFQDNWWGPLLS
jgi:hypothetical protein